MPVFKPGDVVTLKSGGPEMSVQELVSAESIKCKWFGGKKLEVGVFHPDSLQLASEQKKSK